VNEAAAWVRTERRDDGVVVRAGGRWEIAGLARIDAALRRLAPQPARRVEIDLSAVEHLDTAGAWLLHRTRKTLAAHGVAAEIVGAAPAHAALLERVGQSDVAQAMARPEPHPVIAMLDHTGRVAVAQIRDALGYHEFIGRIVARAVVLVLRPGRIRMTSLVSHLERVGMNAMPIVGLLSFLVGMVIAFQGADQLRRFGAEIFTVNLLGISVMRELGILLTAIIVAGRSGSAFAAEIGTMQVNEEIDAIRTIGLDPVELLVLPRVTALMIALPLLTVYADVMGLLGGLAMAVVVLDLSVAQFVETLRSAVPVWAFWVGIIKAPFFGALIALVGCREGLKVTGSAESVGIQTTRAVVVSIFLVIVVDAVFSIFFSIVRV
jgi:phospholipid/cholesterol/gamma-HCH transport system permease protein